MKRKQDKSKFLKDSKHTKDHLPPIHKRSSNISKNQILEYCCLSRVKIVKFIFPMDPHIKNMEVPHKHGFACKLYVQSKCHLNF